MIAWKQGVRSVSWLLAALGFAALAAGALTQERAGEARVLTAELTGVIGPANAGYIQRAITRAEREGAAMLVIEMDTPGGLDTAMRDINRSILASETPVAVFVHPSGARATSAGAYILYASHIAGMAPGTSVGAATPVQMGGGDEAPAPAPAPARDSADEDGDGEDSSASRERTAPSSAQAMRNKVVNDSVAYIRSLAEMRGRNADWAEEAVREGVSASYSEALELGVIEIVAASLPAFLEEADGRTVTLSGGREVVLEVAGAGIEAVEKTFAEEALAVITDPNIAFLLLNLGFIGLLVSFYNGLEPVTAIAGVIFIIIGFYALNTLPVNYAGAALIILGLVLLVAEAFFASSGLLALGGLAAFAIGSLMLMDTEVEGLRIDWRLIAATTVALGAATFFLVSYGLAAQGRKVTTGDKGLIGLTGRVVSWDGAGGYVMVDGERWKAVSADTLAEGDTVKVTGVEGLTLRVKLVK
ncbi:nodulation protein NfeD [Alkalicaulis satelles]|uniref:Nodulation protein NfeD n=1 Tax=Alkalicaulis satelles TaxID=2609175 RepID=A0A5M6ZJS8_9PROT|nr:nodulation protein NfeD [Alkalicaulis satelles]KAA5805076.1 nodulation protein NfeD [Alkalicaulis satelles]